MYKLYKKTIIYVISTEYGDVPIRLENTIIKITKIEKYVFNGCVKKEWNIFGLS